MPERSLSLPLSGDEIIESLLEKLRVAMKRDCFLSPNAAYEWFKAEVTVKVEMSDVGRLPEAKFQVTAEEGEKKDGKPILSKTHFEVPQAPPNEVRMDAGLPIPTLTTEQTSGKTEIKGIKYRQPGSLMK